ncbi:MAG: arginine--tRNA ligase [Armatimonadia bacterium]|nr:arginine--tRNA ligase [Armatimonadia bacterium]
MPNYRQILVPAIARHLPLDEAQVAELIETPPNPEMGDLAFPCFRLSKQLDKSSPAIAKELAEGIREEGLPEGFSSVEAVGPFVNFTVDVVQRAAEVVDAVREQSDDYGGGTEGEGKTVVIDYSSPNIAKPFGIGHLRSTVIGGALYRIHEFLGWNAVGINHLGDWGTQFGKLITAFRKWGEGAPEDQSIDDLYKLYVKFHTDTPAELEEEARRWHKRMEEGDEEALKLWRGFRQASLEEFKRIYDMLGVKFDSWAGESFYLDKLDNAVEEAVKAGVTKEDDGALIIDFENDALGVWLLRKSDGATLYSTRDLAAALYRWNEYHFDKLLYVVGAPQARHLAQLFETLRRMGRDWWDRCEHVSFGHIHGMSSREGTLVFLEDVLNKATDLVSQIMAERNPDLENQDEVSRQVGVGAIVFADLSRRRIRDYNFSWEEILNFDGETGPYVQYTHARLCSILRKWGKDIPGSYRPELLQTPEEAACVRVLERFPDVVRQAADEAEPHLIAHYLIELATVANSFYQKHRVMDAGDDDLVAARIVLVDALRQVLANGLGLLGVAAPERM